MASEAELVELVQLCHDFTSFKFYAVSVAALWAYDYFLTVKDEVRYAWKMESVFMFVLFLFTRYLPGLFQVWTFVLSFYPGYTSEMCKKTAFLQVMYYTFINAAAQVVLTQRTYAITRKNNWVAGILYTICTLQFGVGVYMFVWAAMNSAEEMPEIPLDSCNLCLARANRDLVILQFSLCLCFDGLIFVFILIQTQFIALKYQGMNASNILDTVTKDAVIYLALISTSHLLTVILYTVARVGLRVIPVVGSGVLIPMMISRMVISLMEAASSRWPGTGTGVPTGPPMNLQDTCSPRSVDSIQLSVFKS